MTYPSDVNGAIHLKNGILNMSEDCIVWVSVQQPTLMNNLFELQNLLWNAHIPNECKSSISNAVSREGIGAAWEHKPQVSEGNRNRPINSQDLEFPQVCITILLELLK